MFRRKKKVGEVEVIICEDEKNITCSVVFAEGRNFSEEV